MRTPEEIQAEIVAAKEADPKLATLTSTSKVATWYLWTYIVALAMWTHENLFEIFKADVIELIDRLKPHSTMWYSDMAKKFQYGYNLVAESDYYDNSNLTETQVTTSKVVSYASCIEVPAGLRLKVARTIGEDLAPLTGDQLTAFRAYVERIKDAGDLFGEEMERITSGEPDSIKLSIDLYYNPLVINNTGGRLDGSVAEPVQDAIKAYLRNLKFDGLFIIQDMIDALQLIDGVRIVDVKSAQAQYGALPFKSFAIQYLPDAGYLRFDNDGDLTINFTAYDE